MKKLLLLSLAFAFITGQLWAQQVVSGKVTDENGNALEGISVKEKGTTVGTITAQNGTYSIKVSSSEAILIFSGIGYNEKEMKVTGTGLDVSLESAAVIMRGIELVGTRSPKRSVTETVVPVDIIPVSKIINQLGQTDINSILHFITPSFNANRQSGSDGADHIDPASIRGMGPDQTLVLINGKRRHQISLVNIYGSRGRGNTGTDLNTIPASAIERIEILRDGASAQYGSDAIAGVVNIILKQNVNEVNASVSAGSHITGYGSSLNTPVGKLFGNTNDGFQYNATVNYGLALKDKGFLNLTGDIIRKDKTFRPNNVTLYPDNYRSKFGDGSYTNYSAWFNNQINLKENTNFYSFGGINNRKGDAFAFTRFPDSERNVLAIYPNGFDPRIQSNITDLSLSMGIRSKLGAWNADFNGTTGSNRFKYEVAGSLNASLLAASPTHFDAGGFQLSQSTLSANFSRAFNNVASGLNFAFGTELRNEQYQIFAGEINSWKQFGPVVFAIDGTDTTFRPGGSQGFPGYQPKDEVKAGRNNIGAYVDAELDITKSFLLAAAIRVENYSDFGFTQNYKLATRIKASEHFNLRGSVSTGFRAPSLPQIHFSSTFTNVVAGQIVDQVIAPNTSPLAKAVGMPELKEEKSTNLSFGFVATPSKAFSLTVDGYLVTVKDRIVLTGLFDESDDKIGSILTSLNVGAAQFFTNAVDTRTTGVDIIASYDHNLGNGRLNATLAGNFNKMKIDKIKPTQLLSGKEDIYFGPREKGFLLTSAPDHKIGLSFDYSINRLSYLLRFTKFSKVNIVNWIDEVDVYKSKLTTDFSLGYKASDKLNITVGGNNIFDVYPTHHDGGLTESGGMWDAVQMGFGGAFYFIKANLRFKTN